MAEFRITCIVIVLMIAVYTDLTKRKIFNWTTYPAIGFGLGLAGGEALFEENWFYLAPCLIGLGVSTLIFTPPFFLKWIGGGDLKLMLAIGSLQGVPFHNWAILSIIYHISLFGAIMALIILIWKGKLLKGLRSSFKLFTHPKIDNYSESETLPYGLAIACGTLWTLFLQTS